MIPRRLVIAISLMVLAFLAPSRARAQHECEFGGEDAANKLDSALEHAKSCKEVASLFNDCRWGSSADAGFGATAVARCEKEFYEKLTTAQKNNYADEMQLCAYEFARQQGTISISEAAGCQVDLAASIAADPHVADKRVPSASFDCSRAQSPLEKAICSDVSLGRADLVLSRVYANDLKFLKGRDHAQLIDSEKQWLKGLTEKCGLTAEPASRKALNCLRNEFEGRFSSLDGCDNEFPNCLTPDREAFTDPEDAPSEEPAAPRASFDCNAPATALQLVICDDHELGEKDLQVAHAFDTAFTASDSEARSVLQSSQQKWVEFVRGTCPLGAVGGIPPLMTRACIRSAYELRARQPE